MSFNYPVGSNIPDDSSLGIQDTRTVADPNGPLDNVQVSLQLTPVGPDGGWIGDLYAYLRHTDAFGTHTSILLNRIGRTSLNSAGLSDGPAIDITLTAGGPDIHALTSPLGASLTGQFGADGRAIDPNVVLDTTPRTAGLAVFSGAIPNGDWTLFVADLSGGSQYRLDSWELDLTSHPPVPEPQAWAAATGLLLIGIAGWRRCR
jgi:subtilisin-like proprotein convertase family protein